MTSCVVFNHHSLPFDSVEDADESVPDFLKLCVLVGNIGLSPIVVDEHVDSSWFRLELAQNYFWQDWYKKNQKDENRDVIRSFRSIATRQPLFSIDDLRDVDLFEVSFENMQFSALRAAAWNEAPLVSLPTHPPWIDSPLRVSVEELDDTGELSTRSFEILNFFSLHSFEKERKNLLDQRNSLISSGRELFENYATLFPNLVFCGNAVQQLNNWSASRTILNQVKESLTSLNTFCDGWAGGTFANYSHEALLNVGLNHRVSGESVTVMNDQRLRRQREFWLPEGRKETFENHVKLSNGYRLHFYPDDKSKHIYVGHVGSHLRLR
ncbi:MAG: hypothetical protein U9R69_10335 [Thermodesulfobacteriota bacterium]|nr:hypothetical protein [Thermodesulfobacteriota bacterium]